MKKKLSSAFITNDSGIKNIVMIILLAAAVNYLFYLLFYYFSPFIWSKNINLDPKEIAPGMARYYYETGRDGIEGIVLYTGMLLNLLLSYVLAVQAIKLKSKIKLVLIFILTIIILISIIDITIVFPENLKAILSDSFWMYLLLIVALCLLSSFFIHRNYKISYNLFWLILLLPICLVAPQEISYLDYVYIFTPSLKILQGFRPGEIYFQYDIFISMLASVWMKLNLDLNSFQIIGEISIYLLLGGMFLFSQKYFINKKLTVFFLLSLVICRIYANDSFPSFILAATPLRLDLWFLIILSSYFFGINHWLTVSIIGILALIHRSFGLIYLAGYCELIFLLFVFDLFEIIKGKKFNGTELLSLLTINLKKYGINISILIIFNIIYLAVFHRFIPDNISINQNYGIGFLKISRNSFYWFIPVLFSSFFIFLVFYRKLISERHFQTNLFLILLAIGNSIYFFGRSHENNILCISAILVFLLYNFIDLILIILSSHHENNLIQNKYFTFLKYGILYLIPSILVIMLFYEYSLKIINVTTTQYENLNNGQFIYKATHTNDFSTIKAVTKNSPKVFFISYANDFDYYYYGNYKLIGYYQPLVLWILKKEMTDYFQSLLDNDYYLVITDISLNNRFGKISYSTQPVEDEIMQSLKFKNKIVKEHFLFLSNF